MDNFTLLIRKARKDEVHQLIPLIKEMALETEGKHLDDAILDQSVNYLLDQPRFGYYLVAENQGGIVGCLLVTKEYTIEYGDLNWIQSLFVRKEFRNQKIFRRMYDFVISDSKEYGTPVKLYVEVANLVAIKVYKKIGMNQTDERLFEDDFVFQPIQYAFEVDKQIIISHPAAHQILPYDLIGSKKSAFTNGRVEKCLKDRLIIQAEHKEDKLLGYYFIEYSDWRFGQILWFYDFKANTQNQFLLKLMLSNLFHAIKQEMLNFEPKVTGLRILFHKSDIKFANMLQELGFKESHYYIFQSS